MFTILKYYLFKCTRMAYFKYLVIEHFYEHLNVSTDVMILSICAQYMQVYWQTFTAPRSMRHKWRTWTDNLGIRPHLPHLVFSPFRTRTCKKVLLHPRSCQKRPCLPNWTGGKQHGLKSV